MLKFAINMEEEIIRQIENLAKDAGFELREVLDVFLKMGKNFLEILKQADMVDIDRGKYPEIRAEKILGSELTQLAEGKTNAAIANICALWMVYALLEKSAQYYQQAALNSAHPALKIFLSSLGEIKNILRMRTASQVRIVYNDIWGKVGFAPFVLGKD